MSDQWTIIKVRSINHYQGKIHKPLSILESGTVIKLRTRNHYQGKNHYLCQLNILDPMLLQLYIIFWKEVTIILIWLHKNFHSQVARSLIWHRIHSQVARILDRLNSRQDTTVPAGSRAMTSVQQNHGTIFASSASPVCYLYFSLVENQALFSLEIKGPS